MISLSFIYGAIAGATIMFVGLGLPLLVVILNREMEDNAKWTEEDLKNRETMKDHV